MTQTAIDALCNAFRTLPQNEDLSSHKAEIIRNFAVSVSHEVSKRAGVSKDDPNYGFSLLAVDDYVADILPPDNIGITLGLYKIPSSMVPTMIVPDVDHALVFCKKRVVDWNDVTNKPYRVMTYEEAARFVVFWLAEKILQIIRKNEWDRIKQMPDLFDRLALFTVSSPALQEGSELKVKFRLNYDPDDLLISIGDETRFLVSVRTYNILMNNHFRYVGDVIQKSEAEMFRLVGAGQN